MIGRLMPTLLLAGLGLLWLPGCGDDGPTEAEKRQQALADAERQQAIDRLQSELDILNERLADLDAEIADHRRQLDADKQQEPQASLIAKIDSLGEQIEQIRARINEATQARDAMEAMSPETIRQQPEISQALRRDMELQTLKVMLDGIEQDLRLAEERGMAPADLENLRERLATTRSAYEQRRDAAVAEVWQAQLAQRNEAIDELQAATQELREQQKQAEAALYESQKDLVDLIDTQTARRQTWVDQMASLQARINHIREGGPLSAADRLGATSQPEVIDGE